MAFFENVSESLPTLHRARSRARSKSIYARVCAYVYITFYIHPSQFNPLVLPRKARPSGRFIYKLLSVVKQWHFKSDHGFTRNRKRINDAPRVQNVSIWKTLLGKRCRERPRGGAAGIDEIFSDCARAIINRHRGVSINSAVRDNSRSARRASRRSISAHAHAIFTEIFLPPALPSFRIELLSTFVRTHATRCRLHYGGGGGGEKTVRSEGRRGALARLSIRERIGDDNFVSAFLSPSLYGNQRLLISART